MRSFVFLSYSPNSLFHSTRTEEIVKSDIALELMEKIYQDLEGEMEGSLVFELSKPGIRPDDDSELLPYISFNISDVFFANWDDRTERVVYSATFDFNLEKYIRDRR